MAAQASGSGSRAFYEIAGDPPREPDAPPLSADYRVITPSYFETMRIPFNRGRGFGAVDTRESQPVAIVSEAFAARHWPDRDPIGRQIVFPGRERVVATIVGTAGDITHDWFSRRNYPTVFRPASQAASQSVAFALRTGGDPAALSGGVRAAVARIDAGQAVYQVMTQRDYVRERTIGPQYAAAMMALFGALALLLSVIGIYALVGYFVTQHRKEIGVRMALGAQRRDVVMLTVRQAAVMAAFGVGIGTVAAYVLSRVLESAMFGIAQNDLGAMIMAGGAAGRRPA